MTNQQIIDALNTATPCDIANVNNLMSTYEGIANDPNSCNNAGYGDHSTLASAIDGKGLSDIAVINSGQSSFIFREIPSS